MNLNKIKTILMTIPYFMLYINTKAATVINIKFPKNVLKREVKTSGIKYNTNHNDTNMVKMPITFVLFSSLNIFFTVFILIFFVTFESDFIYY